MAEDLLRCWILEFLLRHRIPDADVHRLFLAVPLPPSASDVPLRLKKSILIRRIVAAPISERSLHSLELLLHLNLVSSLPLARSAYCHAAVGSALAPLAAGDLPDFFDAVERIWVMRVGDLEGSEEGRGLVSEALLEWKRRMAAATAKGSGREARDEVLSAWSEAEGVAAVREYLVRELEAMGAPVLEKVAEAVQLGGGKRNMWEVLGERREDASDDCVLMEDVSDDCVVIEGGGKTLGGPAGQGVSVISSVGTGDGVAAAAAAGGGGAIEEMETSDGLVSEEPRTGGAVEVERREPGACLRGISTVMLSVTTPEVNKVKENLKRSREELQNVVEDPLPNAKKAACKVIARKEKEMMQIKQTVEKHCLEPERNQDKLDVSVAFHSADKGSEVFHTGSTSVAIEPNKDPKKVSGHSLMDWNPTAETYEWEDESVDSELDNVASPLKKLRLPSPRLAKVSPLQLKADQKVGRRRRKWSVEEEDALREGVKKHGEGKWAIILSNNRDVFEDRTAVDLKDKWRNLTRD